MPALPAEEGAEGGSFGNAFRKPGIPFPVSFQHGITADHGAFAHGVAEADFRVKFIFEGGIGKLGAGIEGGARAHRFAGDFVTHPLQRRHDAFQVAVGDCGRVFRVEKGTLMQREMFGTRTDFHPGIRAANIAPPLYFFRQVAFIRENFRAIGRPEQYGHPVRVTGQGRPLPE